MYIRQVEIQNIRSIKELKITFQNAKGWHVLIGDNGAGKSTIIRSIALGLVGPREALGLRADWNDWLNNMESEGFIKLKIESSDVDKHSGRQAKLKNQLIPNELKFSRSDSLVEFSAAKSIYPNPDKYNWGHGQGWFSVAYGPFRRFAGGNLEWTKVFYSQPKLGAHLSVFGEDVALTEALEWLVKLNHQALEKKEEGNIIEDIKKLVNSPDFLPHGATIESVSSAGVTFRDGNGALINVNQLSDGYRSILSLTFELIRQLIRVYGQDQVFHRIRQGEMVIDLPGVVLIDEIDAHLHPTWQTRIGNWFTKYFTAIQFIVTSHSPLVCRASTEGSIWRLASPGSENLSGEVTGKEKDRILYGNVLDAFGTELFGKDITVSKQGNEKRRRMGELNVKSILGSVSPTEQKELLELKEIFPTEKPVLK